MPVYNNGDITQALIDNDTALQNVLDQFNVLVASNPLAGRPVVDQYEIPVVVHVYHQNGPENISDAQIHSALQKANNNLAGMQGGVDTKVKLVLAKVNPYGNCTNGIIRVQTPYTSVDVFGLNPLAPLENVINTSQWDPERYMNIYVLKDLGSTTLSGYGTAHAFASGLVAPLSISESVDGFLIRHDYFGTIETAVDNYINALTKQVGHYLSLWDVNHPNSLTLGTTLNLICDEMCHESFECMTKGDFVCDTERAVQFHFRAPAPGNDDCTPPAITCPLWCPGDDPGIYPIENYMNVSHVCQNQFTQGQVGRMHVLLQEHREKLWSDENRICTGIAGYHDRKHYSNEYNLDNIKFAQ